jgi:hypothetical protein
VLIAQKAVTKGGDRLRCPPKLRQTGRRLIGDTSAGFVSFY